MEIIIISLLLTIALVLAWVFKLKKELKEQRILQNEMRYDAEHDSLTGLANGVLFIDRLNQAIKNAKRYKKKVAILYLGLDNFKNFNDTYGTNIGDILLQQLGTRLEDTLRDSDTVARLGGDEFILILDHFDDSHFIRSVVDKVMKTSHEPFSIQNNKIDITFSLGISIFPDNNVSAQKMLTNASYTMHKVKSHGKNNYLFYTTEFAQEISKREKLVQELLLSLEKNQMQIHYQPQINVQDNTIIGMEAFLRWNHPVKGLLYPESFLHLAQEVDFLQSLEEWVLATSIQQFEVWRHDNLQPGTLSVNLSAQRLKRTSFIRSITQHTNHNPSIKQYLQLEISEEAIMQDPDAYAENLRKLVRVGIALNVDRFGLVCSSLHTLKSLKLNSLKLDKSLFTDLHENVTVLKTFISIAKNLNIPIGATGIETTTQRDTLLANGCSNMQGNLFYKPMLAHDITNILYRRVAP